MKPGRKLITSTGLVESSNKSGTLADSRKREKHWLSSTTSGGSWSVFEVLTTRLEQLTLFSFRIQFNILWIEPTDVETIPEPMLLRLDKEGYGELASLAGAVQTSKKSEATQLRAQIQRDALRPLASDVIYGAEERDGLVPELVAAPPKAVSDQTMDFDVETVQDTKDWLLLSVRLW